MRFLESLPSLQELHRAVPRGLAVPAKDRRRRSETTCRSVKPLAPELTVYLLPVAA